MAEQEAKKATRGKGRTEKKDLSQYPCKNFFLLGGCDRGEQCLFSHGSSVPSNAPQSVVKVKKEKTVFGAHGHPALAAARRNAEATVYDELFSRTKHPRCIVDVGGASGGFKRMFHRVTSGHNGFPVYHCLAPVCGPTDQVRSQELRTFWLENYDEIVDRRMMSCNHLFSECTCCDFDTERAVVFCHSFYYMKDADLARLRFGDEVYIITHRFDGESGSLPLSKPEFVWNRNALLQDRSIVMEPRGSCGNVYSHSDTTPILDAAMETGYSLPGDLVLFLVEWRSDVEQGGSTFIYKGTVQRGTANPPPLYRKQEIVRDVCSPEAVSAAEAMASTVTAAMSAKDRNATVRRIARTLNAREQLPQVLAEQLADRAVNQSIQRDSERMALYTSNDQILARQLAEEQAEQVEVLPVQGPQFSERKRRDFRWLWRASLGFLFVLFFLGLFVGVRGVVSLLPPITLVPLVVSATLAMVALWRCAKEKRSMDQYLQSVHCRRHNYFGQLDENGLLMPESDLPTDVGFHRLHSATTNTLCLGYGDLSKVDPKHEIDIPEVPCERKAQKGATLYSWTTRLSYVLSSCRCNFQNALVNRHAVLQPPVNLPFTHSEVLLKSLLREVGQWYRLELLELKYGDKWIMRWGLLKRLAIQASIVWDALLPNKVSSFIKREVNHSRPSKARLIQGYENLATQAAFAPEFAALQKAWGRVFNGTRRFHGIDITFSSGMNHRQLGDWLRDSLEMFPNARFYERDGKNWDATMQKKHFDLKCLAFQVAGKDFLDFARASFDVRGTAKNLKGGDRIRYRLRGTVKSGHNDTSSGNSLVNAMIIYEAMRLLGLKGRIIVNGDDCLVVLDRNVSKEDLMKIERALGIVPEARVFDRWQDVSFLSGIWAPTGDDEHPYAFIPKPGRLLARCFWSVKTMSKKQMSTWARDVAACILVGSRNVPVISTFLCRGGGLSSDFEPKTFNVIGRNYSDFAVVNPIRKGGPVVQWFLDRYHIDSAQLAEVEGFLNDEHLCPTEVGVLVHPILERIQEVDNADIDVRECSWEV